MISAERELKGVSEALDEAGIEKEAWDGVPLSPITRVRHLASLYEQWKKSAQRRDEERQRAELKRYEEAKHNKKLKGELNALEIDFRNAKAALQHHKERRVAAERRLSLSTSAVELEKVRKLLDPENRHRGLRTSELVAEILIVKDVAERDRERLRKHVAAKRREAPDDQDASVKTIDALRRELEEVHTNLRPLLTNRGDESSSQFAKRLRSKVPVWKDSHTKLSGWRQFRDNVLNILDWNGWFGSADVATRDELFRAKLLKRLKNEQYHREELLKRLEQIERDQAAAPPSDIERAVKTLRQLGYPDLAQYVADLAEKADGRETALEMADQLALRITKLHNDLINHIKRIP